MAKVGNEASLILKLARERVKQSTELVRETKFRAQPGNYPEKFSWIDALAVGYSLGIRVYEDCLYGIVAEMES